MLPVTLTLKVHEDFDNNTIDEIMNQRQQVLNERCTENRVVGQIRQQTAEHLQYDNRTNIVQCLVAKVGSTFWGRIFYALNREQVQNPYDIPLTGERKSGTNFGKYHIRNIVPFLEKSRLFLITRDPFSRVLSAYVDKLFSPNPYYWNSWGTKIINKRWPYSGCGHDTTFQEFVDFVSQTISKYRIVDVHFMPLSKQCDPCRIKYDYIGKLETSRLDTFYILEKLGLTDFIDALKNGTETRAIEDAMYDTALGFVYSIKDIKRCMSLEEAGQRLWRRMQIRGYISFKVPNMLSGVDLEKISIAKLVAIMRTANKESRLKYDLKREKKETLKRAYNRVSVKSIEKLVKVYIDDFQYFGYDNQPKTLLDKTVQYKQDIFDFKNKII